MWAGWSLKKYDPYHDSQGKFTSAGGQGVGAGRPAPKERPSLAGVAKIAHGEHTYSVHTDDTGAVTKVLGHYASKKDPSKISTYVMHDAASGKAPSPTMQQVIAKAGTSTPSAKISEPEAKESANEKPTEPTAEQVNNKSVAEPATSQQETPKEEQPKNAGSEQSSKAASEKPLLSKVEQAKLIADDKSISDLSEEESIHLVKSCLANPIKMTWGGLDSRLTALKVKDPNEIAKILDEEEKKAIASGRSSVLFFGSATPNIKSEKGWNDVIDFAKSLEKKGLSPEQKSNLEDFLSQGVRTAPGSVMDKAWEAFHGKIDGVYNLNLFSKDYDEFKTNFLRTWAMAGGSAAHYRSYMALKDYEKNAGKDLWLGKPADSIGGNSFASPSPNMMKNLAALHEETRAFYKAKFSTKSNLNPDLKTKPLSLQRGVSGDAQAYSPAPIESWTVDKATPARFGKMMADPRNKGYSVLSTSNSYDNVLFSWESLANYPAWPKESELKGKKEFVVFGGALDGIKSEFTRLYKADNTIPILGASTDEAKKLYSEGKLGTGSDDDTGSKKEDNS